MSDRLKELQRQRALAQEQLAFLDREIARETGGTTQVPPSIPVSQPVAPSVEDIIAQFQRQDRPVHSEVKRGCFLYFFVALGLLGLALVAFYYLRRH